MSELRWTETMRGRVGFGATDFNQGWWSGSPLAFTIDVRSADLGAHSTVTGHVDCPALGGRLAVTDGTFELLPRACATDAMPSKRAAFASPVAIVSQVIK